MLDAVLYTGVKRKHFEHTTHKKEQMFLWVKNELLKTYENTNTRNVNAKKNNRPERTPRDELKFKSESFFTPKKKKASFFVNRSTVFFDDFLLFSSWWCSRCWAFGSFKFHVIFSAILCFCSHRWPSLGSKHRNWLSKYCPVNEGFTDPGMKMVWCSHGKWW